MWLLLQLSSNMFTAPTVMIPPHDVKQSETYSNVSPVKFDKRFQFAPAAYEELQFGNNSEYTEIVNRDYP